jgi:hypothetical protein
MGIGAVKQRMTYTGVPQDTMGLCPLKSGCIVKSYHGVHFSVDLHVTNEDTFQNKSNMISNLFTI